MSITLTLGALSSSLQTITGDDVAVSLLDPLVANDIDILTNANSVTASAANGNIIIENVGSFSVGDDGILADDGTPGDAVFLDVTLKSTGGSIGAGAGTVTANVLTADADGAIALTTQVSDLTASALAGDITVDQSDTAIIVTSAIASGSVSITSDDAQMDVFVVQGSGDVTLTTTGVDAAAAGPSDMTLAESSVIAGGTATLTSAGDMAGELGLEAGDVVADTIILESNGDTGISVSAETDKLTATALGSTATTLEIVQVNDSPVFIGGGLNPTNLSSAGSISFESSRTTEDADGLLGNDIIVLDTPDYDAPPTGAGTLEYSTEAELVYAVSTASLTSDGNLEDALESASTSPNAGSGTTRVAFGTNIRSAIQLTSTVDLEAGVSLDGRQRINTLTGGYTIGRPVDIDGSRLTAGDRYGFDITDPAIPTTDDTRISGLAFYGFNEGEPLTGGNAGAGIRLNDISSDVYVTDNYFGLRSNGRSSRNANGIVVGKYDGGGMMTISGNTIVRSSGAGILIDPVLSGDIAAGDPAGTVEDVIISNNLIGTNMRRRNYRNADGIVLEGTGSSGVDPAVTTDDTFNISLVEIKDNMVAYSSNSGITVRGANDVVIQDNTLTLNRANGIAIGDDDADAYSSDVSVVGNEITRSGTNGVYVGNGSAGIDVGTTIDEEGNRIGTNNAGRRGLGNRANGVYVDGAGASVSLAGNLIMSNGARRTTAGRSGIKLSNQSDEVVITENNISMNRDAGIEAETAGTKATITKNTIFRNYGSGIKLTDTAFADLVVGSLTPTGVSPTDQGNTILSNRRYGIDALGGAATVGGNVTLGNRRGGIDSAITKPTITSATLTGDDLTVTLSAVPALGDIIHLYLGTGRRSRSQGYRYIGSITGDGATDSFDLLNLDAELRVRVGSSLTATTTPVAGGGVSEFSDNVSIRRP